MNYKVVCNGHEFEFSEQEINDFETKKIGKCKFHFLDNNRSYFAKMVDSNFNEKKYLLSINGRQFNAEIKDKYIDLIKSMGLNNAPQKNILEVKSPMPGLVLEILVKVGDKVKEGDTLLILEAMKMENSIKSPGENEIKSVEVKVGETVEKSQLLIEFK